MTGRLSAGFISVVWFGLPVFVLGMPIKMMSVPCETQCTGNQACTQGCSIWPENALQINGSCQPFCATLYPGSEDASMVNCRQGCDYAVKEHVAGLEGLIRYMSPPFPGDRVTPFLMDIEVEDFPAGLIAHLQYVEWIEETNETANLDWKFFKPDIIMSSERVEVTGLSPYTYYKFRLFVMATAQDVLYGDVSIPFQTEAFGPPSDAPRIVQARALSPSQIYVQWEPPKKPNGRLIFYPIAIRSALTPMQRELVDLDKTSKLFTGLMPGTEYFINVRAAVEGPIIDAKKALRSSLSSPFSNITIITPFLPGNPLALGLEASSALFATQQHVYRIPDLHNLFYEDVVYPFNFDHNSQAVPISPDHPTAFRDFVYDIRRNSVILANNAGELLVLDINKQTLEVAFKNSTLRVSHMGFDWMRRHLYFVNNETELTRCTFWPEEPVQCQAVGIVDKNIKKIIVDPINGFIFWMVSRGMDSAFYRSPLVLGDPDLPGFNLATERVLYFHRWVNSFEMTFEDCRIYFPEIESGHAFALNDKHILRPGTPAHIDVFACDGSGVDKDGWPATFRKLRASLYIFWQDLIYQSVPTGVDDSYFYGFDSTKLYSESRDLSGGYQHASMSLPKNVENGVLIGMRSANMHAQPWPRPLNAPTNVRIRQSHAGSILVVWEVPKLLQWQSSMAWNSWSYNVSVSGRPTVTVTNATETYLNITSDTVYMIKVQAVGTEKSGLWSDQMAIRTYPQNTTSPRLIMAAQGLVAATTLDEPGLTGVISDGYDLNGVTDVVWGPEFVALYKSNQNLVIIPNGAKKPLPPFESIERAASVTYDWIGRNFYWAVPAQQTIQRASLFGFDRAEVVVSGTTTQVYQVILDPLRGSMYWCSTFIVEISKLNGQNRQKLMELSPLYTERINSIAIDAKTRKLYVIVRRNGGTEVLTRSLLADWGDGQAVERFGMFASGRFGQGMVSVFEGRLIWKDAGGLAATHLSLPDNVLRYHDSDSLYSFTMVPYFDDELKDLNRTYTDFEVIPASINSTDIKISDIGDDRVVTWPGVTNCNYGTVQYDVKVTDVHKVELVSKRVSVPRVTLVDISSQAEASLLVSIRPVTEWGSGEVTLRQFGGKVPDGHPNMALFVGVGILLGMTALGAGAYCLILRRRRVKRSQQSTPENDDRIRSPLSEDNAIYELGDVDMSRMPILDRNRIYIDTPKRVLGNGAFGEVFFARSGHDLIEGLPHYTELAIKQLLRTSDGKDNRAEFVKEASFMSQIRHKNILTLFGVCIDSEPYFMVMEYMDGGDLRNYLRSRRPGVVGRSALRMSELVLACRDVASACSYLQEHSLVHRDLAARNCLVSEKDGQLAVVKISDFGLARDIYHQIYKLSAKSTRVPVRWMAPESLKDGTYTCESDVWSYGVVMWEVMTYGQEPYFGLTNEGVVEAVKDGHHPVDFSGSLNVPASINNLMIQCWTDPSERPSFRTCVQITDSVLDTTREDVSETTSSGEKDDPESFHTHFNPKSGSAPNLCRTAKPRARYAARSSPELHLDHHSSGSNDSGLAITPRASIRQPEFVMPLPPPPIIQPVAVLVEDDQGYLPIHPGLRLPPPYLSVLNSTSRTSLSGGGHHPHPDPAADRSDQLLRSFSQPHFSLVHLNEQSVQSAANSSAEYCNAMLI